MSRMDLSRPPGVSRRSTSKVDALFLAAFQCADEVVGVGPARSRLAARTTQTSAGRCLAGAADHEQGERELGGELGQVTN